MADFRKQRWLCPYLCPRKQLAVIAGLCIAHFVPGAFASDLEKQFADFNFDGHGDFRVLTLRNGKADQFDVYIWDTKIGKHVRNAALSGTIKPWPKEEHDVVECTWSGGHSGTLYTKEIYRWDGDEFRFVAAVRQECVQAGEKMIYVRVRSELRDGRPVVTEVTRFERDE